MNSNYIHIYIYIYIYIYIHIYICEKFDMKKQRQVIPHYLGKFKYNCF